MLVLCLIIALLFPLVGLFNIENGDLGGYPNSSIFPYFVFILCIAFSYAISDYKEIKCTRLKFLSPKIPSNADRDIEDNYFKYMLLGSMALLILISYLCFGGVEVLLGNLNKGSYRIQMGYWGIIMAIPTKFIFPVIFTRLCFCYNAKIKDNKSFKFDYILILGFIFCFFMGITLGNKSYVLSLILGGLISLLWGITKLKHVLYFSLFTIVILILSCLYFDRSYLGEPNLYSAIRFVYRRAFTLSAEGPWKIWNLYIENNLNFDYYSTLLGVFGSVGVYFITGVPKYSLEASKYNFGRAFTEMIYPQSSNLINSERWNMTATAYAESIIVGGIFGIVLFGIFAGWLFYILKDRINAYIKVNNFSLASVFIIYFMHVFLVWIISGGITTLINPVGIIGLVISYLILIKLEKLNNTWIKKKKLS